MKIGEFKALVEHLGHLTRKQRASLLETLQGPSQEVPQTIREIEARVGEHPTCPYCHSEAIGNWGKAHGLKRFRCQDCKF